MVDFDVVTGSAPPLRLPGREPPPAKDKASNPAPPPQRAPPPPLKEAEG